MADIATPEYLLGDRVPEGRGSDVLYNLLLNLSLTRDARPSGKPMRCYLASFPA